ncbi:MAG TPA: hypothetical protein VGB02_06410 [Pyrinomonadaceae bacterium]|jgi:hypothetical protein
MIGKKLAIWFACGVLLFGASFNASAQQLSKTNIVKVNLSQAEIDRIIKTFTEKELQFRQALTQYSFKRKAEIQIFGDGGQVTGEYIRESQYMFGDDGTRYEKVLFMPIPTMPPGVITAEDLDDLGGINPFALEPSKLPVYNFTFVGKERIDELDLYVFDVEPRIKPDPKKSKDRFFSGRVWVDAEDLQIVKTKGKGLPETKDNKFPVVETWRENIGGKYWFPTYSYANDELYFESGNTLKIKVRVRYTDFKEAKATVRILDDEEAATPEKPQAAPTPTPKKP